MSPDSPTVIHTCEPENHEGVDVEAVFSQLEKVSPQFASAIGDAVREVRRTMQFAVATGVHRPIVFKPLFMLRSPHAFFDGICFEVVKGQSTNQKRSDVLAIGGQ